MIRWDNPKKILEMEMRKVTLVSITLVWVLQAQGFTYEDKEVETEAGRREMYERWRIHHKMEKISESEKEAQFKAFKSNLELVHNTNKMNKGYKLKLNAFAGMTHEELTSKYTGRKTGSLSSKIKHALKLDGAPFMYANVTDFPPRWDWREHNAVTPVTSQEHCGSCYAFSAVAALEGLHAIKNKELIALSPKELLDCANVGGCNGGIQEACFEWIAKNGGLTTWKNYPYKPEVETCRLDKAKDVVVHVHGYENLPMFDEEALMKAVINQPVAVGIEVNPEFGLYKEGVLDSPCGTAVQHAVLLVGYDETPEGVKYWTLKNSWGEAWGDKGYIKILRGIGGSGYCGIAMWSCYPTIEDTGTKRRDGEPIVSSEEL